ncbi:MAG: hypothetical protein AB7G93_07110 [Bdellovibrionales bacterium]
MSRIVAALAVGLLSASAMHAPISAAAEVQLWRVSAEATESQLLATCDPTLVRKHLALAFLILLTVTGEMEKKNEGDIAAAIKKSQGMKSCEDLARVHEDMKSLVSKINPDLGNIDTQIDAIMKSPTFDSWLRR